MNLSEALEKLKDSRKISKKSWDDKALYLYCSPKTYKDFFNILAPAIKVKHLVICKKGKELIPYMISESDALADDWQQLGDEKIEYEYLKGYNNKETT